MSKRGATRDYKFGQKNHWRRTAWNEVLRRTNGREHTQPILYLAGSRDLDRKVAVEKGVPNQNLIAIDRSKENAIGIRSTGVPALHGDALDILWSWPKDRPVCAVLLDFCSGLEYSNLGIYDVFQRESMRDAVVMVNFMRGRDPWSNGLRELLRKSGLDKPLWMGRVDSDDDLECVCDEPKHRAYQFLLYHAVDTMSLLLKGPTSFETLDEGPTKPIAYRTPDDGQAYTDWVAMIGVLLADMRPTFYSYKSGSLTFDSCVFRHPCHHLSSIATLPTSMSTLLSSDVHAMESRWKVAGLARRIAATLAVRTRRMVS